MTNRTFLAALLGGVAFLLLGRVLAALLPELGTSLLAGPALGVARDPGEWWALLLGSIAIALLIALVYERYAAIITFRGGAETGAWMGALLFLGVDLLMLGGGRLGAETLVLDVVLGAILGAVTGGVVGAVLGYRNPDRRGGSVRRGRRVRI